MIHNAPTKSGRSNRVERLQFEFVVVGGGLAGICAALAAARRGLHVGLVQDRPVLGGNASSEVRMWTVGATSHLGNNNRWSREGGIIEELLSENLYRNRHGNPLIFDTILLEKVSNEDNITMLLNTSIYGVELRDDGSIFLVRGFSSQNSVEYEICGTFFCDASGDGVVGHLAGAGFRMGAEARSEFDEPLAPISAKRELLGHTLYFYSKSQGEAVEYIPPSFAKLDVSTTPRRKKISKTDQGCHFWWLEFGGLFDTVYESEAIKWELWRIVYGVWDHIKNSGEFDDVEDLTLEWVGTIPGKRESRRFNGLHMLSQSDLVEQRHFHDTVAHGGWAIDHHPPEGIYSDEPPCEQWHIKGVYQIPLRCFVSEDVRNLFFAGRTISTTHIAFGSSRVMLTCAIGGQAVGHAVATCIEENISPAELTQPGQVETLQQQLNLHGQSIPGVRLEAHDNLCSSAQIRVSSTAKLAELRTSEDWEYLTQAIAQLLPLKGDQIFAFEAEVETENPTNLTVELRISSKLGNYTPDKLISSQNFKLRAGRQQIQFEMSEALAENQYIFLSFLETPGVRVRLSDQSGTGITSVQKKSNAAVSNFGEQVPPADSGIDRFEFWTPRRVPDSKNIALKISPPLECYNHSNLINGLTRPTISTNAWAPTESDIEPTLTLTWREPQEINEIILFFDTDFDNPLENTLWVHPKNCSEFCVQWFEVRSGTNDVIFEDTNNYHSRRSIKFDHPLRTDELVLKIRKPSGVSWPGIFEIICR